MCCHAFLNYKVVIPVDSTNVSKSKLNIPKCYANRKHNDFTNEGGKGT